MTVYGDLTVSALRELPKGRSPISTQVVPTAEKPAWLDRVWQRVREEVESGHQAYVVCPRIGGEDAAGEDVTAEEESTVDEVEKRRSPLAVQDIAPALTEGPLAGLRLGVLHGRLPADEKDAVMRAFAVGSLDVLIATTVIEVGVDVPNANLMIVEHAERFGLSQLHQLRGRIGRGAAKSYCVLVTCGQVSPEAEQRLDAMVRTNDGFEIAELDLQLRGPGEFFGTRQAGMPDLRVANIIRDRDLLELAKREAAAVIAGPSPEIPQPEIARALNHLRSHWNRKYGLVEVG